MKKQNREDLVKSIQRAFNAHDIAAFIHIDPLIDMLMDNPDKAIDLLVDSYNKALDDAYTSQDGINNRWFVEAIAGGPYESIPWRLYNAIGSVYPYLERKQKDKALSQILRILDKRNYAEVNGERGAGHTTGIREPLLLSDITIVRTLYWPGLFDEKHLWEGVNNFYDLQKDILDEEGMFNPKKVKSDFLVAYALMRNDITPFGEDYVKVANPPFLNKVLKGTVAMRFGRMDKEDGSEQGMMRLLELLPSTVHERLEPLREERDWVDYKLFT